MFTDSAACKGTGRRSLCHSLYLLPLLAPTLYYPLLTARSLLLTPYSLLLTTSLLLVPTTYYPQHTTYYSHYFQVCYVLLTTTHYPHHYFQVCFPATINDPGKASVARKIAAQVASSK